MGYTELDSVLHHGGLVYLLLLDLASDLNDQIWMVSLWLDHYWSAPFPLTDCSDWLKYEFQGFLGNILQMPGFCWLIW